LGVSLGGAVPRGHTRTARLTPWRGGRSPRGRTAACANGSTAASRDGRSGRAAGVRCGSSVPPRSPPRERSLSVRGDPLARAPVAFTQICLRDATSLHGLTRVWTGQRWVTAAPGTRVAGQNAPGPRVRSPSPAIGIGRDRYVRVTPLHGRTAGSILAP
jgi:hypothetical protein